MLFSVITLVSAGTVILKDPTTRLLIVFFFHFAYLLIRAVLVYGYHNNVEY